MNPRTAAAVVAVLALALSGCAGGDTDPKPSASPSASASPTVDRAAARQQCKEAWRQDLAEDDTFEDGQMPTECKDVPDAGQVAAEVLRERNEANRELLEACMDDPSDPACEGLPIP